MRNLLTSLMAAVALLTTTAAAGDGIKAVRENGRLVYVNEEAPTAAPARPATVRPARVLVYWSKSERRWKRVAPASPVAMQAAQSAAAEVTSFISTLPKSRSNSEVASVAPEARQLVRGRMVTPEIVESAILQAAERHHVDPNLVRAIIKVESNFNARAVSHKGAMGLMQLMPQTARSLNVTNPFDPQQNVDAGVRHFKGLMDRFGDLRLSLAAYNAGAGAVQRNGGVPPYRETREYVRKITDLYGASPATLGSGLGSRPVRAWRDNEGKLNFSNVE